MTTKQLATPWRNTSFFKNLKEVNEEGYKQMIEYEKAGGELDDIDRSAKEWFEKSWKRHRRSGKHKSQTDITMDINGDVEQNDSWDDE